MSALTGKADINVRSAIGQKRTLGSISFAFKQKLLPKLGHDNI